MAQKSQSQPQDMRKTLAVLPAKVQPSLEQSVGRLGNEKILSLQRASQVLDTQLTDAINNIRHFRIIARSDLEQILDDQDLQDTFSAGSERVPERFSIEGADYLLIPTVDDFRDVIEQLRGEGGTVIATKREIHLGVVTRIYDSETGELLETANFRTSGGEGQRHQINVRSDDPNYFSEMTRTLVAEISVKTARRVLDVIHPARVLARTGGVVTISRGDGSGIEVGQNWNVYALGERLIDPVTGMDYGIEEVEIGTIEIINVRPMVSQGRIVEDFGVEKNQIVRLIE